MEIIEINDNRIHIIFQPLPKSNELKQGFYGELDVRFIDGEKWKVINDFTYVTKDLLKITVEAGFITDFASIPRAFWSILPPNGQYSPAALIHDLLYRKQNILNRKKSDLILLEAMVYLKVPKITRNTIYYVVRSLGWAAWDEDRQALRE